MKFTMLAIAMFAGSVFADQCAWISKEEAVRASLLIQNGAEVSFLCQPCGEKLADAKVSVVRKAEAKQVDREYFEVSINGKPIDLAYTYIKVAPNKFVNVAKVVGCEATDVSPSISQ